MGKCTIDQMNCWLSMMARSFLFNRDYHCPPGTHLPTLARIQRNFQGVCDDEWSMLECCNLRAQFFLCRCLQFDLSLNEFAISAWRLAGRNRRSYNRCRPDPRTPSYSIPLSPDYRLFTSRLVRASPSSSFWCSSLEPVLEFSRYLLHWSHTSCARSLSPLRLHSPIVYWTVN